MDRRKLMQNQKKKLTLRDRDSSRAPWSSFIVVGSTCRKKRKLNISIVQNIKKKNVPGTQDASHLESLVLLLLPPLRLLVVLLMVAVIVVVGSTCKKKKKLNISIVQNIKKKMYLGLRDATRLESLGLLL